MNQKLPTLPSWNQARSGPARPSVRAAASRLAGLPYSARRALPAGNVALPRGGRGEAPSAPSVGPRPTTGESALAPPSGAYLFGRLPDHPSRPKQLVSPGLPTSKSSGRRDVCLGPFP